MEGATDRAVILRFLLALAAAAGLVASGCRPGSAPAPPVDSTRIVADILTFRAERDSFLLTSDDSPMHTDAGIRHDRPRWYPPDIRFFFRLKLMHYTFPRKVTSYGTKGEPRVQERYGYFELPFGDTVCRLNVYRSLEPGMPRNHLSVAFTDETTGRETYGVGRYLPVEDESSDRDHLYEVDFNKATNPYCAYNDSYTCAVPLREDHLPIRITAGELRYHP